MSSIAADLQMLFTGVVGMCALIATIFVFAEYRNFERMKDRLRRIEEKIGETDPEWG